MGVAPRRACRLDCVQAGVLLRAAHAGPLLSRGVRPKRKARRGLVTRAGRLLLLHLPAVGTAVRGAGRLVAPRKHAEEQLHPNTLTVIHLPTSTSAQRWYFTAGPSSNRPRASGAAAS